MLSFFRTNQFIANIFLIFYAAIIRLVTFIFPNPPPDLIQGSGVLGHRVFMVLDPAGKTAAIISLLLVCFQALLINIILSRHRLASEFSLLPGMFYIFLASSIPEFLYLSPALLGITFFIVGLSEMFDTYKKYEASGNIFNVGFWIGLGSLFYPSLIVFMFLALIGLRSLRSFSFKENLILYSGIMVPFFLSFVGFFWFDQFGYFVNHQFVEGFGWFDFSRSENWEIYAKLSFFGLLILLSVFSYNRFMIKKNIQVQKDIEILYWSLLITLLAALVQADLRLDHLILLAPALSVFLTFRVLRLSRPMAEAVHLLLLAGVLILQYKDLLG